MGESKNIKLGIVISYITLLANIAISIFLIPYILKALGNDEYGLYTFVNSITSWLTILTSSLSAAYVRYATINYSKEKNVKKINTIYGKLFLILTGIICLISSIFTTLFFAKLIPLSNYTNIQKETIAFLFLISSLQIIFTILFTIFSLFNDYQKKFILTRSISLFVVLGNALLSYVVVGLGANIIAIAIVHFAINTLSLLINMAFAFKNGFRFGNFKLKENKELVKSILIFSSFLLLNTLVDQINNSVDKTILGFMVNAEAVTTYQLGQQFTTYLITMSVAISGTFIPKINELVVNQDKEKYNKLFLKIGKLQSIIILFVVGGFAAAGYDFVVAWLDNTKNDPLQIYIIGLILLILYSVPLTENASIEVQRALNKHKFRSILYISIAVGNMLLSILLVYLLPKEYSVYGCLIGTIVAMIIGHWIVINIYNKKIIKLEIEKHFVNFIKYFILASISFGITFLATYWSNIETISYWLSFFIKGLIYTICYASIASLFNYKEIKAWLLARKSKRHLNS